MKAISVKTDGSINLIDHTGKYPEIKDAVGGFIECVNLAGMGSMYINEEGKLLGLPINHNATALYQAFTNVPDVIVGDAILFGPCDDRGDETEVTNGMIALFGERITIS